MTNPTWLQKVATNLQSLLVFYLLLVPPRIEAVLLRSSVLIKLAHLGFNALSHAFLLFPFSSRRIQWTSLLQTTILGSQNHPGVSWNKHHGLSNQIYSNYWTKETFQKCLNNPNKYMPPFKHNKTFRNNYEALWWIVIVFMGSCKTKQSIMELNLISLIHWKLCSSMPEKRNTW